MIETEHETVQLERVALQSRPDRFRSLDRDHFDVIIVGAGTGGLTAAALLARQGQNVLVLDHQYVAGGNATVFRRGKYEFDVGLYYLGNCGPKGTIPKILRTAGITDVTFLPMDSDGFDTLCFSDFRFRVPNGVEAFAACLAEQFPSEERGITRYVEAMNVVWALQGMSESTFCQTLSALWRARTVCPYLNATLGAFLDTCTSNRRLRAVLAAQSVDYAEPPSRASFIMHVVVILSYLAGACYPAGGGQVLSDRLAESLERHGGSILLRAPATKICIGRGRVCGVEFESKHIGRRTVRAPVVISNADLKESMLRLVGTDYLKPASVRKTQNYEMAPAIRAVYLGVRRDLHAEGVPNTNFWIHPSCDQEAVYAEARGGKFHPAPFCYVSIATLKDPANARSAPPGIANIQLMTIVPSQVKAWGVTAEEMVNGAYNDNPIYERTKQLLAARLIATTETVFPGLSREIIYQEVATPLTHRRFTRSTGRTSYGLALIPA